MKRIERIKKDIESGELDSLLTDRYKRDFPAQKKRLADAVEFYCYTYGFDRKVNVYSVPYSLLLVGDGADLALPTSMDAIAIVSNNSTNISRLRCRDYTGEDNVDLYQHGPYTMETPFTTAVVRGVQQAFLHFKYKVYGLDIYIDADTLPGSGLDESAHLAMTLAYIYNDIFNEGKLTSRQLSEAVQWALANFVMSDSYATDVYASLEGRALSGDFTNTAAPKLDSVAADMCAKGLYSVNIGTTSPDIPEEDIDTRLDGFIEKIGRNLDEISEKEFFEKFAAMENADREAAVYIMDYYSQENFSEIYGKNAPQGIGSPSLETSLTPEKDSVGGAIKWHNKVHNPYWMELCCVADSAKERFVKAMETQFGTDCVKKVDISENRACVLIG